MEIDPQIEQMRQGVEYRGVIAIRGFKVFVRPLSISETSQVAGEVISEMEELPAQFRTSLTENLLLAKKYLVLATTSEVGKSDPKLSTLVLDRCTPDEIQCLYDQYLEVVERVNPKLEELGSEEIDALVTEVKKNPSVRTDLSRSQLASLVGRLLSIDD